MDLPVKDEFEPLADNLELNLDSVSLRNPFLIVFLGEQTKEWYPLGKTSYEGTRIMVLRLNWDWNNWFMNQPIFFEKGLPA